MKIKNLFMICVLTCFTMTFYAQSNKQLKGVVIEDSRLSVPFNKSSRNIEILDKKEIQKIPAQTINGILQYVGGVDIRQRGPNNVQADISFRGSTFEQVLVLINGVKIITPQTGHHILNLPIDLEIIERIEIIKGPSARVYGQNAFAGAINIVTKVSKKESTKVDIGFGKHKLFEGKLSTTKKNSSGKSRLYFSASNNRSDGYTDNTDYNQWSFFLQNDIDWKKNKIVIQGSYIDNGFGSNSFYAAPFDSLSYEQVKTALVSLSLKRNYKKGKLTFTLFDRFNHDNYIFNRTNRSLYENNHYTNVGGATIGGNYMLNKFVTFAAGVEGIYTTIESNNLGDHDRLVLSGYGDIRFHFYDDRINITPGVAYHNYSDFDSQFFYGADASIQIHKNLTAFGNIGTTYRIPTYTELYYSDRKNLGNENLEPEEALAYEAGFKFGNKKLRGTAAYFNRAGTNIIDWQEKSFIVDSTEVLKWQPSNITELNVNGFDGSIVWRGGVFNFLNPLKLVRVSYTYIDGNKFLDDNVENSRYALQHVVNQVNISTQWSVLKVMQFNAGGRYMDRLNQEDYWVMDMGFGLYLRNFSFSAVFNNVMNEEYEEMPGITMPKKWWKCKLTYKL